MIKGAVQPKLNFHPFVTQHCVIGGSVNLKNGHVDCKMPPKGKNPIQWTPTVAKDFCVKKTPKKTTEDKHNSCGVIQVPDSNLSQNSSINTIIHKYPRSKRSRKYSKLVYVLLTILAIFVTANMNTPLARRLQWIICLKTWC